METGINKNGEIRGAGPAWGCIRFGLADHDYHNCPECKKIFSVLMDHRKEEPKHA